MIWHKLLQVSFHSNFHKNSFTGCFGTLHLPTIIRSSPTDDLVDWNWGVSVRPSIRTYVHKKFSDFHLIWCMGRPRPRMCTSVTSTRSKVRVKVMELPKLTWFKVKGLMNFRQLPKPCMLAAMTAAPLRGFLGFRSSLVDDVIDWNSSVSVRL